MGIEKESKMEFSLRMVFTVLLFLLSACGVSETATVATGQVQAAKNAGNAKQKIIGQLEQANRAAAKRESEMLNQN